MASLQAQKRRIKSIESTSNIARAMELVSSVKLKKLKNKYDNSINYLNELEKVIKELLYLKETEFKFNKEGLDINIVITSNLGLCGVYNAEVIRLLEKEKDYNSNYIVFGEKGISYLKNKGYNILFSFSEYDAFENDEIYNEFSEHLFKLVNSNKIKTLSVIYTKYINNLKYEVVKEQVYPFNLDKSKPQSLYMVEIDAEDMLRHLMSLFVKTKVNSVLLNSILSENASRNIAMKNAKDNADDLKEELKLVYNKLRQQQITNELSDIVNGI